MKAFFLLCLVGVALTFSFDSLFSTPLHVPFSYEHEESVEEVIKFWTPERLAKAIPKENVVKENNNNNNENDSKKNGDDMIPCEKDYEDFTNSSDYTEYPLKAVGVIFFYINKTLYQCSASIGGGKYIWTAAHCLYDKDTGDYAKRANFIPGYYNGSIPYKQFPLHYTYIPTGYKAQNPNNPKQSQSYDYAMAALHDNVESMVGAKFDLLVNLSPSLLEYWSLGYPVQDTAKETIIHSCISGVCGRDESTFPSPLPVEIKCDAKGGSSGGPWLIQKPDDEDDENYYLNGLNSYSYALKRNSLYGPYFNDDTNFFYLSVVNGTTPDDHRQKKFLWSSWFFISIAVGAIALSFAIVGVLRAVVPRPRGFNYANVA